MTTGDPGYIADLLRRMRSDALLGPPGVVWSSDNTVSWHAHREAERLADLACLGPIAAQVQAAPKQDLDNLAFILAGLIANTRSAGAIELFLHVAAATPDTRMAVWNLISYAQRARIRECRGYVLGHLGTKDRAVFHAVVWYLCELGDEVDVPILTGLLDADCHGKAPAARCATALGRIGARAALPALVRAVERHRQARRQADRATRLAAQAAILAIEG